MSTRFGINLSDLDKAAKQIFQLKDNFLGLKKDRVDESLVFASSLVSVQSFYSQINTLMSGTHGVAENLQWHEREAQCVANCLRKAGADVCYVEDSLESVFHGTYESGAEELSHVSPQIATGRGMQFKDGRLFPSFMNLCDPVVPEPLGRPVEQLVNLFSTIDIMMLMQIKEQWNELNKSLSHQVEEIRKTAFII